MPLQEGRDLHIDQPLSNIMLGRRPEGYIADQLLPIIPVSKQSNIYRKSNYREAMLYTPDLTRRAKGAESREVYFSVSSDTYFAQNYALGGRVYDEDLVNEDDAIASRENVAGHVTDMLLIDYEARVAALANLSTSVGTTTSVLTPWSNTTGSRPFDDLATLIELFRVTTMKRPNLMIIPEQIATYLRRSDQFRDLLYGDKGGIVSEAQIASLLKIGKVLVPEIMVNTTGVYETKIGSGTITPVWPNKVFLAYVANVNAKKQEDTWLTAFRWTDPSFGVPFAIRVFDHEAKKRSQKLEAAYYQQEKVIASDLGIAINSVIV